MSMGILQHLLWLPWCGPLGPRDVLPEPCQDWHRLIFDDGEWDLQFQYLGAPAMRTSSTDVARVVWKSMYCCRTVAGTV